VDSPGFTFPRIPLFGFFLGFSHVVRNPSFSRRSMKVLPPQFKGQIAGGLIIAADIPRFRFFFTDLLTPEQVLLPLVLRFLPTLYLLSMPGL